MTGRHPFSELRNRMSKKAQERMTEKHRGEAFANVWDALCDSPEEAKQMAIISEALIKAEEAGQIKMTEGSFAKLVDLLENPPAPNEKLIAAAKALPDTEEAILARIEEKIDRLLALYTAKKVMERDAEALEKLAKL